MCPRRNPRSWTPYKQQAEQWRDGARYPAIRILEKLRGMGFDKGYSIVKAYVSSRKMDKEILNYNMKQVVAKRLLKQEDGRPEWAGPGLV